MFNHETPIDSNVDEGVVIEVDPKSRLCKVKTITGRNLTNVRVLMPLGGSTRAGVRLTPMIGDAVFLSLGLGSPVIIGYLPKIQSSDELGVLSVSDNAPLVDTGDFGIPSAETALDTNKPKDVVPGDQIHTTPGGGLLGLLRGGSMVLRSSRLSEIFLSKLQDLVRVVSRNFEHFTDVSSTVFRNFKNRVYRYSGYSNSAADSRIERYTYHQFFGDVGAAEAIKTNYANFVGVAATNDIIAKEKVTDNLGTTEKYRRELHLDGTNDVVITSGSNFTRVKNTASDVQVTFNDTNVIKVNATELSMKYGTTNSVVITPTSITLSQNGSPLVVLNSSGITMTFGSHFMNLDSTGAHFG